jgi:hypothetical protein
MPIVFCSTKLSKLTGLKTRLPSLSMGNWNGHLFALQGRKCLVFVHKETFYSFVIFDILKRQLIDFKQVFTDNFIKQLEHDNLLSDDLKHSIVKDFQNLEFSTTDGDKSTIGYLNDCIARLTWERNGRSPTIDETKIYVENYYNENPLISRKGITPKELMNEKLKNYVQQ